MSDTYQHIRPQIREIARNLHQMAAHITSATVLIAG
jgi:hypothetical protein